MKVRSQIFFMVIAMSLIIAILGIGFYSGGLKRARKLEKTVQATFSDLEWRFEERDEYLSQFLEFARKNIPGNELFHSRMQSAKDRLIRFLRKGTAAEVMHASLELESVLREFWKYVDANPALKENPEIKAERQKFSEMTAQIISFRTQYNQAVEQYNAYLKGIPGRFLGKRYTPATSFPEPRS